MTLELSEAERDRVIQLRDSIFNMYHKIGKSTVWSVSNDEVADLCEQFVYTKIDEIFGKVRGILKR